MRRPIKFRLWDVEEKQWVELSKVRCAYGSAICLPIPEDVAPLEPGYFLSQFTGLHDRNGKEIYEGDIVSSPHFKDAAGRHHTLRHVCEWSDRYHSWFLRNIEDQTSDKSDGSIQLFVATRNTDLEIIGNQYETPSLIQGETE